PPLSTHPQLPPTRMRSLPWGGTFSRGKSKPLPLLQDCARCPIIEASRLQKAYSHTRDEFQSYTQGPLKWIMLHNCLAIQR
ncbi:hypothetical protein STEG23_030276, partial [Scotinomys teguina]